LAIELSHFLFSLVEKKHLRFKIEWLDDLSIALSDALLGLLSGIPKCCVLHFVLNDDIDIEWIPEWVSYFPCRKCLLKGRFAHKPFQPLIIESNQAHLFTLDEQLGGE